MNIKYSIYSLVLTLISFCSFATGELDSLSTLEKGLVEIKKVQQSEEIKSIKGEGDDTGVPLTVTGSFRFFGMYRNMYNPYPIEANVAPQRINISGFGDGSRPRGGTPMLTLWSKLAVSEDINMGFGIGVNHIFSGSLDHDSTRFREQFGQTFGAFATYKTKIGNLKIGGGNNYTGMSELFSGWSTIRWNPFYRLPWNVSTQWGGSWNEYENTFLKGGMTEYNAAFVNGGRINGVVVQMSDMPEGFGFNLSYGANGQTGLYQVESDTVNTVYGTKRTFGGRVYKKHRAHQFGANLILNNGYIDNVTDYYEKQYMYSVDAKLKFPKVTIASEFGATEFSSPLGRYNGDSTAMVVNFEDYTSGVDFLAKVNVQLDKEIIGIPLNFMIYHLGANFVNENSGQFNTSTYNNAAAYLQINRDWDVAMRRGFITDLNQTANNRQAVELSTKLEKGRFRINLGTQVGREIESVDSADNQVMFYHKMNPWSRASFQYWTPTAGPYQKLMSSFIQLLERVPITDSIVDYKKTFNVFDVDARYKTTLFGRALILSNYMSYMSASDVFSPIPYFSDKAFVRVFYSEVTAYYQLYKKTVILGHVAHNKAVGNYRTALSPDNGKPIDQDSWALGMGIDWNFAPNMGLYFREMWMTHKDKNFKLDHFSSYETSVELKVMF